MSKYLEIIRINSLQQLAYGGELVMRGLSMVLFMAVFIALWSTAYGVTNRTELAGYTLAQMIWYLAMTETVTLSASRIQPEIDQAVKAGDIAYALSRPYSYPLFQVASSLGNSAVRFVMNLGIASVLVWLVVGHVEGSPTSLAAFLLLAAGGVLLDTIITVGIGLLAFFIEETTPIYWIYQKLIFSVGGLFLPLEVFPTWLRTLSDLLPFRYVVYAPARTFVRFDPTFFAQALVGQAVYLAISGAVVYAIWRVGTRRVTVQGG